MWSGNMGDIKTTEYLFLKLALIFGLLYVFIIPPFQMPDEDNHFKKAFMVSKFTFLPEVNAGGQTGNHFPKSIIDFENSNKYMVGNMNAKYNYNKFYYDFALPKDYSDKIFLSYSTSKTTPLLYFPQATAMLLTKVIMFDPQLITPATYLYAGRIGNLLFFIICAYFAIRIIPFYKRLMMMVCLMPMTITLASSLSYDGMIIGISLLFISIILNYAFNDEIKYITKKEIIILSLLSVVLIELKQVYFPLIGLYFFIPREKFTNTKKYYINFVYIFFIGIITHIIWMLLSKINIAAAGDSEKYIQDQLNYVLGHPIEYLMVIIRTFDQFHFFYINSFIGNLGWLDTNFPYIFILMYSIFLFILAITDINLDIKIGYRKKMISLFLFISIVILIETVLYLIWTSIPAIGGIGYKVVTGVQGRYFIPAVLLLCIPFYSEKLLQHPFLNRIRMGIIDISPIFCLFSCIFTLLILILRYWIPIIQ
jgi:uncharacterized membrane protein